MKTLDCVIFNAKQQELFGSIRIRAVLEFVRREMKSVRVKSIVV